MDTSLRHFDSSVNAVKSTVCLSKAIKSQPKAIRSSNLDRRKAKRTKKHGGPGKRSKTKAYSPSRTTDGCHPNNSSRCLWVMGLPKSSDDNEWEEKWRTVRSQFSSFVDFMALFQPDHWLTSMKGDHPSIFKTAKTIVPLLFEYLLTFLRCSACHHHCRQHQVDDGKLPWYMKSLGRPLPSVFEAFDFTPEEEKKNE